MENLEAKNITPTVDEVNSYGLSMSEWHNLNEDEKQAYRNSEVAVHPEPTDGEAPVNDAPVQPEAEWDAYGLTEEDWNALSDEDKDNYRAIGTVHKEEEVDPTDAEGASVEHEV